MRVLQVLSSLNRLSGVANVVMNYYRLVEEKVKFDFLLYGEVEESFAEEVERYGSRIYYIPKFGIASYRRYQKEIKKFFREHGNQYEIVHIHEIMSQRVILPIAKKCGLKVVMHSHGPFPDSKMVGFAKAMRNRFLLKGFDRNADYYLACSAHAAKAFKRQKQVTVLNNGVDIDRYIDVPDLRNELGISKDAFVVGCVGRITRQKNPTAIIEIFSEVKKIDGGSLLVVAGSGDDGMAEMAAAVKQHNLDNSVKFIGNCKTIPALMKSLDAMLMPSLWEGLPVVLVEAQAAGLPCYCSDNIPQEANLTGNVKFLSLETGFDIWAKEIRSGHRISRQEIYDGFLKTGYELKHNAEVLLDIYREVAGSEA